MFFVWSVTAVNDVRDERWCNRWGLVNILPYFSKRRGREVGTHAPLVVLRGISSRYKQKIQKAKLYVPLAPYFNERYDRNLFNLIVASISSL